jgi:Carboxypeptidase regulatory-like domain
MRKVSNLTMRSYRAQVTAFAVLMCVVLSFASGTAWAQKVTAAITGKVTDTSGAAIAGAKVTATDLERGTALQTVTNSDGDYNLPQVPVGIYTVKVENAGFQAAQQSNLTLVLNQVARLDFQLHPFFRPNPLISARSSTPEPTLACLWRLVIMSS